MNRFEFFIRRPVFSTVMSLIILLCGVVSYGTLTVREYPNIDQPVVNVTTEYPGASAEIIESQVTQILEASIAGIAGIEIMISNSRSERSQITVRFRLATDADVAASDVRDRVGRVRRQLPGEIEEPVIAKVEADAQAIINIAFTSDRHKTMEISDYADRYIRDQLQNLPGRFRGAHLRRAALFHAHLGRPREACGSQPHRTGRGRRVTPTECRGAVRPN